MDDAEGSLLERQAETVRTDEPQSRIKGLEKGGVVNSDGGDRALAGVPLLEVVRGRVGAVRGDADVENGIGRIDAGFCEKAGIHAPALVPDEAHRQAVRRGEVVLLVWKVLGHWRNQPTPDEVHYTGKSGLAACSASRAIVTRAWSPRSTLYCALRVRITLPL
jgi:hypothetical protein